MPLHRLTSIVIGVPNVAETKSYYREWGLAEEPGGLATVEGGRQLALEYAPTRRLIEIGVGVDDLEDLERVASSLKSLDVRCTRDGDRLVATEPIAGFRAAVSVAPRIEQVPEEPVDYNGPGRTMRRNARADGIARRGAVRPRKLGHVVIGSVDQVATQRFFVEGLGFKVSDRLKDSAAFMRCSTDHHNVLVVAAPVNFLHHTSWQVRDVDEIGRGATAMLAADPARHVWGLGRHHVGSNFFWYLRDPAGNFTEYYADMDCILDDAVWTPQDFEGLTGLYAWGPPPPPSMLEPEDLATLMMGAHSSSA